MMYPSVTYFGCSGTGYGCSGNCCHGSGCLGHHYMYYCNFFNSTNMVSIILYYFVMKVERNTQPLANNAREYMQFFYK